ncbi:MAG: hypothetical protein PHY44_08945 [Lachnospiraceae bacterium]|nr:hypothetical protein [Lachnospiraceae bacterium]
MIDVFSGRPIEHAKVHISETNSFMVNKGNGFFVAINLKNGTHNATVSAVGYEIKKISFETEEICTDEAMLVSLMPANTEELIRVGGELKVGEKKAANQAFYYTFCCEEYRKRITSDVKNGSDTIRLQMYDDTSLEGRKFVLEEALGIYTLGRYDYVEKRYKLKENSKQDMEMGQFAYLIFEGKTDNNGRFEIVFPKFIMNDDRVLALFFLENKSTCNEIFKEQKEIVIEF